MSELRRPAAVVQLAIASAIQPTRAKARSRQLATDFVAPRGELATDAQIPLTLIVFRVVTAPEKRKLRKQVSRALCVRRSCAASGYNHVAAAFEQRPLAGEPSHERGMVAGQHRQRWCQPLRALADSFQVVVEPGWLTAHKQLEWLELCVQKLRSPGQDRFLRGIVGAAERQIGSRDVENRNVVSARSGPEARDPAVDCLQVDPGLNRWRPHMRSNVMSTRPVRTDQSSRVRAMNQPSPTRRAQRPVGSPWARRHTYRRGIARVQRSRCDPTVQRPAAGLEQRARQASDDEQAQRRRVAAQG